MIVKIEKYKSDEDISLTLNRKKIEQGDMNSLFLWSGEADDIRLEIYESETGSVYDVNKDSKISTPVDEIISQFNDQKAAIAEIESSGIEHTDDDTEEEPFLYDPDLIRVDPRPYQVNIVNELIEKGEIDLSPDFQRHFVWKNLSQRSRLIESMMLRIPLPVFYLAQDSEGKLQVVDGLQRLTVIKDVFIIPKNNLQNCFTSFFNYGLHIYLLSSYSFSFGIRANHSGSAGLSRFIRNIGNGSYFLPLSCTVQQC